MAYCRTAHLGSIASAVTGAASDLLRSATGEAKDIAYGSISRVRIRTAVTPEIVMDFPLRPKPAGESAQTTAGSAGPSAKDRAGRFVKPAVILESPYLSQPVIMAPYGIPTQSRHGEIVLGGAVVAGLALYGALMIVKRVLL